MARIFLLLVMFVPVLAIGQDAKPIDKVTIADVIAGLKQQEAAMQTLQVTLKVRKVDNFGMVFGGGSRMRSSFTEQWHTDTACIGWNHATGSRMQVNNDDERKEWDFEHHSAFDGEFGTSLTTEERETGVKRNRGSVGKAFMRYALPPGDFTFAHQQRLISENLENGNPKIIGTDEWEGQKVLLIETVSKSKDSFFKGQYLVDPNRDFLVASRRNFLKEKAEDPWLAFYVVNSKKHKKYADFVWLPDVVETRSYAKPTEEGGEPRLHGRLDATCSDWKINEPIDQERLRIKFPKGLKVHGADQFEIEYKDEKPLGFFVAQIKTSLQRSLLRPRNETVYAVVDAPSFADANTGKINPRDFDMVGFKKQLSQNITDANQTLMLRIEYGDLGTDNAIEAFIQEPLKSFARSAGFKNVRIVSSYGGRAAEFTGPDDLPETSDETELGNGDWSIYIVGTPFGRYLAGDGDVLITSTKHIPLNATELLDDAAVKQITKALDGQDIKGKKLNIKFVLGDKKSDPKDAEGTPVMKKSSEIQLDAVNKLRNIGFGDIVLKVTVSYSNHLFGYKQ